MHVALHVGDQHLQFRNAVAHRTAPHQHFRCQIGDCAAIGEPSPDQAAEAAPHRRIAQAMALRDGLHRERYVLVRPDASEHAARVGR